MNRTLTAALLILLLSGCGEDEGSPDASSNGPDAPVVSAPIAAETPRGALAAFAAAMDAGDWKVARTYVDQTTTAGREYTSFLQQVAGIASVRSALLRQVEAKFGAEARKKASGRLWTLGPAGGPYASMVPPETVTVDEETPIWVPGFTGFAHLRPMGASYVLDVTEAFQDAAVHDSRRLMPELVGGAVWLESTLERCETVEAFEKELEKPGNPLLDGWPKKRWKKK